MERWLLALLMLSLYAVVCSASSGSLKYEHQNHCNKFNTQYEVGALFTHPDKPCVECKCCDTGKVKCKKKTCKRKTDLLCGSNRFQSLGDECCYECDDACQAEHANNATCNNKTTCAGQFYFGPNDCCGSCGCLTPRGELLPPTGTAYVDTQKYPACEKCTCNNGTFACAAEAPCPAQRLKCVDGHVNNFTCKWECPHGPGSTCLHGDKIVNTAVNVVERIGEKICTCYYVNGDYLYDAICANADHIGKIERTLMADRCMKQPISYTQWT